MVELKKKNKTNFNQQVLPLDDYFQCLFTYQFSLEWVSEYKNTKNDYKGLLFQTLNFNQTGGSPIILRFYGKSTDGEPYEHAVLPYRYEKDGNLIKLYFYDPNVRSDERYLEMNCNSDGKVQSWKYSYTEDNGETTEVTNKSCDLYYGGYFERITKILEGKSTRLNQNDDMKTSSDISYFLIKKALKKYRIETDGETVTYDAGTFLGEAASILPVTSASNDDGTENISNPSLTYVTDTNHFTIVNDEDSEVMEETVIADTNSMFTTISDGQSVIETSQNDGLVSMALTPSSDMVSTVTYETDNGDTVIKLTGTTDKTITISTESGEKELIVDGIESGTIEVIDKDTDIEKTIPITITDESFQIDISDEGSVSVNEHYETELINAKEATCTKEGYTGDEVCKICHETIQTGSIIPMTEHEAVTDKAVKATYAKKGLTEGSHCKNCGKVLKKQTTVPKKTVSAVKNLKLSNQKNQKVKISWSKNKNVKGYEIQYADNKKFSKKKTIKISKNSTKSAVTGKLKAKTKYYVRIRGYVTYKGKTYYSKWSGAKTIYSKK